MNFKKTKLSKDDSKYLIIILSVAFLFVGLSFMINLFAEPGFELSCSDGKFIQIHLTELPALCMACSITCKASIQAYINEELICNNTVGSMGSSIIVPCKELDNFVGKEVIINSVVNSSTGHFESQESVKIEY